MFSYIVHEFHPWAFGQPVDRNEAGHLKTAGAHKSGQERPLEWRSLNSEKSILYICVDF